MKEKRILELELRIKKASEGWSDVEVDLARIQEVAWETMGTRQANPHREPGYIYYHGLRVGQIALQLRKIIFPSEEIEDQIIQVASWFHDVGKGIEPHWKYGALLVGDLLEGYCSEEELNKIQEIIHYHSLRKEQKYPYYVQLVQDADTLDHFGSQEIWLNFMHTAHARQNVDYVLEFYQSKYEEQVSQVRRLLNYPESVEFFNEKDLFVRNFIDRFAREGRGELV